MPAERTKKQKVTVPQAMSDICDAFIFAIRTSNDEIEYTRRTSAMLLKSYLAMTHIYNDLPDTLSGTKTNISELLREIRQTIELL